jgi:hypothetical protein
MSRHRLAFCLCLLLPVAATAADDREKDLLRERRDALDTLFRVRLEQYKAGFGTLESAIGPSRSLLLTELELAPTVDARLALCDRFADLVKQVSELNESRRDAGKLTDAAYALAKAAVLEDRVLLLRERLKDGPVEDGKERLRKLLLERREAYQAALLALDEEVKAGTRPPSAPAEVSLRSLRADLEVTDKPAARAALYEATVARLTKEEEVAKEQYDAGRIAAADYALTRAVRAAAEAGLLREKRGAKAEGSEDLQRLLAERRDAAREIQKARQTLAEAGRASPEAVLEAAALVLEAEVELAADPADQVALLKKYVRSLKIAERAANDRFEAGAVTAAEVAMVKATRLDAEIRLVRAERKTK